MKQQLKNHTCKILQQWQTDLNEKKMFATPIDQLLKYYFKSNKSLGSTDRNLITDSIFKILRNKTYLDTITPKPITWENQLETVYSEKFTTMFENKSLLPNVRSSCPKELFDDISNSFGPEKAFEICKAQTFRAPLTIRVNPLKIQRDELLHKWKEVNKMAVKPTQYSPYGIQFTTNKNENLYEMIEYKKGYFEIQDQASQLTALQIKCQPGQQVLDYCAGSGGKSLAFGHLLNGTGQLYLYDIRDEVLTEAKKRFRKSGIQNVQFHNEESLEKKQKALKKRFDWVLCDVPCSGTGILRRSPDLKYKYSKERLEYYKNTQRGIFKQALKFLKEESGTIGYSTCSVLKEENNDQVDYFCKEFGLKLASGGYFQSIPDKDNDMDGFFCATLQYK